MLNEQQLTPHGIIGFHPDEHTKDNFLLSSKQILLFTPFKTPDFDEKE
jgi:hypothetical protein